MQGELGRSTESDTKPDMSVALANLQNDAEFLEVPLFLQRLFEEILRKMPIEIVGNSGDKLTFENFYGMKRRYHEFLERINFAKRFAESIPQEYKQLTTRIEPKMEGKNRHFLRVSKWNEVVHKAARKLGFSVDTSQIIHDLGLNKRCGQLLGLGKLTTGLLLQNQPWLILNPDSLADVHVRIQENH